MALTYFVYVVEGDVLEQIGLIVLGLDVLEIGQNGEIEAVSITSALIGSVHAVATRQNDAQYLSDLVTLQQLVTNQVDVVEAKLDGCQRLVELVLVDQAVDALFEGWNTR